MPVPWQNKQAGGRDCVYTELDTDDDESDDEEDLFDIAGYRLAGDRRPLLSQEAGTLENGHPQKKIKDNKEGKLAQVSVDSEDNSNHGNPFVSHRQPIRDRSLLCGLGNWRPSYLEICSNMYVFTALVGMSYLFSGLARTCLSAQLVSIERQFNIDSSRSGMFISVSHFGEACVILFVAHCARWMNIPVAIGICGVLNGMFTMLPSFLELMNPYQLPQLEFTKEAKQEEISDNARFLCMKIEQNFDAFNTTTPHPSALEEAEIQSNELAYYSLLFSMCGQGVVNAFRYGALPFVYVDNNIVDKTRIGVYMAIAFACAEFVGPFGDLINSFLSLVPVDLSDTAMTPEDPRFVSAWWLGFLVFGLMTIIFSIPIILVPRHMIPVHVQKKALDQAMVTFAGGEVDLELDQAVVETIDCNNQYYEDVKMTSFTDNIVDDDIHKEKTKEYLDDDDSSLVPETEERLNVIGILKEFPKSMYRVFSSPLYTLLAVEITAVYFLVFGIHPFHVKYVMFEYDVSMSKTNLAKGMSSAITHIIGTIIGSAMSTKIQTRMGYLKLILITSLLTFLITPLYIVFGCDNQPVVGLTDQKLSVIQTGEDTCHCHSSNNLLSCGDDGQTFLSPCYAGCQKTNGTMFFQCNLLNTTSIKQVKPGICDVNCDVTFVLFNILAATRTFIFSINNMPRHLLALRILEPEDRAFGNAFLKFSPFLVSVPAPLVFGGWIESMCTVWSSGHCSLYDRDHIRYLIGGVELVVAFLTVFTYYIMMYVCRWMDAQQLAKSSKASQTSLGNSSDPGTKGSVFEPSTSSSVIK